MSLSLTGAGPTTPGNGIDLLNGLEAYYRLDSSGADSSGNGRNMNNRTYSTPGVLGGFQNSSISSISGLSIPFAALSISGWFKIPGVGAGMAVNYRSSGGLLVSIDDINLTATVAGFTTDAVATGQWHHLAAVDDGASVTVYLNGVVVGSGTTVSPGTITGFIVGVTAVKIDEVCHASRAWSEAEVLRLYNGGAGYDPTA